MKTYFYFSILFTNAFLALSLNAYGSDFEDIEKYQLKSKDYYQVLNVSFDANIAVIEEAYSKKIKDDISEDKKQEAKEAWDILKDPETRKNYDRLRVELQRFTLPEKDYYKTLGLTHLATDEEIKKRAKILMGRHHPDRFSDPAQKAHNEIFYKEAAQAFSILKDPVKKFTYDRLTGQLAKDASGFYKIKTYIKNIFKLPKFVYGLKNQARTAKNSAVQKIKSSKDRLEQRQAQNKNSQIYKRAKTDKNAQNNIFEAAKKGNAEALDFIIKNSQDATYRTQLQALAQQGSTQASDFIIKEAKNNKTEFQYFLISLAKEGHKQAEASLYELAYEGSNQILSALMQEALQKNNKALETFERLTQKNNSAVILFLIQQKNNYLAGEILKSHLQDISVLEDIVRKGDGRVLEFYIQYAESKFPVEGGQTLSRIMSENTRVLNLTYNEMSTKHNNFLLDAFYQASSRNPETIKNFINEKAQAKDPLALSILKILNKDKSQKSSFFSKFKKKCKNVFSK